MALTQGNDSHKGELFVFNTNPWQRLTAFKVGEGTRAIVIIGGQGDGFFGLNYTEQLTARVVQAGWCVVQPLFTSWYAGYRQATLENDSEDLDQLVHTLESKYAITEVVLLGHHTGAQDVLYFMQQGQHRTRVSHCIFQGGLRNPTGLTRNMTDDNAKRLAEQQETRAREHAQQLIAEGRGNSLMPPEMHPRPISALRYLACDGMQGVQDFFSASMTEEEMAHVVGHLVVPTLILFCCEDDYKPDFNEKSALFEKIQTCIPADVSHKWIAGSCDESLNFLKGFEEELTDYVVNFLSDEDKKKTEKDEEMRREQEADAKKKRSIVYQKHGLRRSISQSSVSSAISS